MKRRRHVLLGLISAVVACLLVYIVYVMQLKQLALQQHIDVVVPVQFVDAGQMLAEHLLTYKAIAVASFDERMFTKKEEVVGQETSIALGQGEPILDWKLNKFNLMPSYEQSTFQIPKDYILSISNGIRAGDRVRIYMSSEDGLSRRLFAEEIVVASVKSAANSEVEDVSHSSLLAQVKGDEERLYASRRNANASIDTINLNLTEEQWLTIDQLCRNDNALLVIAFTSAHTLKEVN